MVYMMMRISRCNHCESVYLNKYLKMLIKVLHRFMHQTTDFFLSVKPLYILMCTCYCKSQCCCCTLNTVFTYVFSLLVAVCDFAMRMLPDYPRQESHPFPGAIHKPQFSPYVLGSADCLMEMGAFTISNFHLCIEVCC
jgi:hypothetical protein